MNYVTIQHLAFTASVKQYYATISFEFWTITTATTARGGGSEVGGGEVILSAFFSSGLTQVFLFWRKHVRFCHSEWQGIYRTPEVSSIGAQAGMLNVIAVRILRKMLMKHAFAKHMSKQTTVEIPDRKICRILEDTILRNKTYTQTQLFCRRKACSRIQKLLSMLYWARKIFRSLQ